MNAEIMVGDPHMNSSTFMTYAMINPGTRDVAVTNFAKFITYFKQAFHMNYKNKEALYAYIVNVTYEMLLLVRKYDKAAKRDEAESMLREPIAQLFDLLKPSFEDIFFSDKCSSYVTQIFYDFAILPN